MRISKEQRAAWNAELQKRKSKNSQNSFGSEKEGGSDSAVSLKKRFRFTLSEDQMADIYLELQPIIMKYEPIYAEFNEAVFYKKNTPQLDKKADLEEKKLTPDQRLAIFLAYHSGVEELYQMALSMIYFTNFKATMEWVAKSHEGSSNYITAFLSDLIAPNGSKEKEGGNHQGDDERNDAMLMLFDLYESYDIFRGSTFNTYATYWMPQKLKEKQLPKGYNYNDYVDSRKLHSIRKAISERTGVSEDKVLVSEVIQQFNRADAGSLYKEDGSLSVKGSRYVEELRRQGYPEEHLTREFVEAEYIKAKSHKGLSGLRYHRLMDNNILDTVVSLDQRVGDPDDEDSKDIAAFLSQDNSLGYSEDTLSPLQRLIKNENEMELKGKLRRLIDNIPHSGIMLDIILEYADTDPENRVREKLKERNPKYSPKKYEIQKGLEALFLGEVSKEYSEQCGVSKRISKRYAESAFLKLRILNTSIKADSKDFIFDVRDEAYDDVRLKDIYDDLLNDQNERKENKRKISTTSFPTSVFDLDEEETGFDGIFD